MSVSSPPKKNTAHTMFVALVSQANPNIFQSSATLAIGDVKVSTDGGALNNITTLPVVTPAAGKQIQVDLSASEMNGDKIGILFSDAAGAEWCDLYIEIETSTRQVDNLCFPTTSGRSIDVDATGGVEVGTVATGAIATTSFAAGAIDAAAIAANALGTSEIASAVDDRIVDATWNEAKSGHTTQGTYGESQNAVISGNAIAGTLSTTQMSTDLTEATDSHFNGRTIIWTSGVLLGQASNITAYTGATKVVTYTAITEAPSAGDDFLIV